MQFCSGLVSDVKLQQNANLARNLTGSQEVSAGRFRDASIALGIDLEVRASIAAVTLNMAQLKGTQGVKN